MFMRGKLSRATGEDVAVKRALAQFRREEKTARQEQRQARRKARTAALLAWAGSVGRWARPVAPLLFVTGFAMYGQIAYGVDAYSPTDWELPWRLAVAIGVAVAVESIALYVCWHAHDALLMGASATAARMRRGSYLIALAVAGVNYAHFAKDDWTPTPAAVVFALFSASGPWLWGLHTRRAQHIQLLREGQVDSSGAVFSAERWRAFPVRTWAARRWSIDTGEIDPREAWRGYNAFRVSEHQARVARREERARIRDQRRLDKQRGVDATSDATPPATLAVAATPALATSPVATPATPTVGEPGPWRERRVADLVAERDATPATPHLKAVATHKTATLRHTPVATVTAKAATPSPATPAAPVADGDPVAKARALLADETVGRRRLAAELDLKPHQARALLANREDVDRLLPRYLAANA